jgi:violaxanthin de-epoxidase
MKLSLAATLTLVTATNAFTLTAQPQRFAVATNSGRKMSPSVLLASNNKNDVGENKNDFMAQLGKGFASALVALTISFNTLGPIHNIEPAFASDGKSIGLCLLNKCKLPLAKCITNPNCLANVICINTCASQKDEIGCQIKCGDMFDNPVIGEFNKCAVSDMDCVPTRPDDGSYPIPAPETLVPKFNTNLFNGKWYITAGQNPLFDIFPCQVHFFTETEPGKFFGKLNWRITEPDGEYFTRDAIQQFVQDPKQPGHLVNHDNEYLHYQDDWYVIDYAADDNKEGVPPFAFIYYVGANDAWVGYGGVVIYTRDSKMPPELIPRLREAAKKVNFDYDKDFKETDNTCVEMSDGERTLMREQFAGKAVLKTESQIQAAAVRARGNAANGVKAQKMLIEGELGQAQKAFSELEKTALSFENDIVKDLNGVERKIVQEVEEVEKEVFSIFKKK